MSYDLAALIDWHKADCERHRSGQCVTRRCIVRGGYGGSGPFDPDTATCAARETVLALQRLLEAEARIERVEQKYRLEREAV